MRAIIQIAIITVLVIISLFFPNTLTAQTLSDQKNRIYISPLNFVNPHGRFAQFTYGRAYNKGEFQFSYARRVRSSIFNGFPEDEVISLLYKNQSGFDKGHRAAFEWQFYTSQEGNKTNYIAIENFLESGLIKKLYAPFLMKEMGDDSHYYYSEGKVGLNFKFGQKINLGNSFTLDMYGGLGFAGYSRTFYDIDTRKVGYFTKRQPKHSVSNWIVTIPFNVKMAYRF